MAELSSPQREVFEMSRRDGLTYPEIASVLDISVKTVEARMGRALRHLRERLSPWLPSGGGWCRALVGGFTTTASATVSIRQPDS
jgi:hypothetical protein